MVTVVDALCGKGKTSWAIQYMNEEVDKRFIYITQYNDEVDRVIDGCSNRFFYQPEASRGKGRKLEDFNNLLAEGKNIVSTHALFSLVNSDTLEYLKENEYTLIMDEVHDVVEQIKIKKSDRELLLSTNKIEVLDDGKVIWLDKEYDGKLNEYKKQIENGDVYLFNGTFLLWTFPTCIFNTFKESYILTYMFKGQMQAYYYNMNGIEYQYKSVEEVPIEGFGKINKRYRLCEYNPNEDVSYLKELINICENPKLNAIGVSKDKRSNPLSKGWYDNQYKSKTDAFDTIKRNLENYFGHICKGKSNENMWTTFKDYKNKCSGKGYTGRNKKDKNGREKNTCFVPVNARATNEYRHKKNLAYLINKFSDTRILQFFTSKGVEIDDDAFALSELCQWIFRSQLRDSKPINLYIPSDRMRNLLKDWLDNKSEQ